MNTQNHSMSITNIINIKYVMYACICITTISALLLYLATDYMPLFATFYGGVVFTLLGLFLVKYYEA